MRRGQHRSDLTQEELELERAKRNDWYRTRSPEYKAELLRKQREYSARKRAEAKARGETVRRNYNQTKEQKELHSKQTYLAKQKKLAQRQKELEEQGLAGMQVCTVCLKPKPIKNFIGSKSLTKPCKICNECRARIYAKGIHDNGALDAKFWDSKSKRLNQMVVQQLRKEKDKPDLTVFDLSKQYITAAELVRLYNEQDHKCYYCGATLDEYLHIDHKLPRSKGGTNTVGNICMTCPDCNRLKWTRTEEEFISFLKPYAERVVGRFADKEPQVTDDQKVTHSSKEPSRSEPSSPDGPLFTMAMAIDSSISCIPIKENVHTKEGELPESPTGGAEDNRKPSSDQMEFDF